MLKSKCLLSRPNYPFRGKLAPVVFGKEDEIAEKNLRKLHQLVSEFVAILCGYPQPNVATDKIADTAFIRIVSKINRRAEIDNLNAFIRETILDHVLFYLLRRRKVKQVMAIMKAMPEGFFSI